MKYRFLLFIIVIGSFPAGVTAQAPRYARVISQNANLRDTPSVTSGSTQEVAEETLVKVLDEKLPWYVVRVGNHVGWMHGNTLEFIGTQVPVSERPTEQTVAPDYTPSTPRRRENLTQRPPATGGYIRRSTGADRTYITGPRGGCYYIGGTGRKVYVDRSLCN
jgi:uncharacterized protein YgiM (DUF1202 family)